MVDWSVGMVRWLRNVWIGFFLFIKRYWGRWGVKMIKEILLSENILIFEDFQPSY